MAIDSGRLIQFKTWSATYGEKTLRDWAAQLDPRLPHLTQSSDWLAYYVDYVIGWDEEEEDGKIENNHESSLYFLFAAELLSTDGAIGIPTEWQIEIVLTNVLG